MKKIDLLKKIIEKQKKVNKLRKQILNIYEEKQELGRRDKRLPPTPELTVPRQIKQFRMSNKMTKLNLLNYYRKLKNEYKIDNLKDLSKLYKTNYINALKDMISALFGYVEEPKGGRHGGLFYTKEQLSKINDTQLLNSLNLINQMLRMNNTKFYDMYMSGFIVKLKFIYAEMEGLMKEYSPFDEQQYNLEVYNKINRGI